jgi:hypothetical protein
VKLRKCPKTLWKLRARDNHFAKSHAYQSIVQLIGSPISHSFRKERYMLLSCSHISSTFWMSIHWRGPFCSDVMSVSVVCLAALSTALLGGMIEMPSDKFYDFQRSDPLNANFRAKYRCIMPWRLDDDNKFTVGPVARHNAPRCRGRCYSRALHLRCEFQKKTSTETMRDSARTTRWSHATWSPSATASPLVRLMLDGIGLSGWSYSGDL